MNPGGGSGWDEPPLDIQVPDDARELDRDVIAYHREQRAQRRRRRLRRLTAPFAGQGTVMPLLASILAVCLVAGAMLSVATFSPATGTGNPRNHPSATAAGARSASERSSAPPSTAPPSSTQASSAQASKSQSSAGASSAASPSGSGGTARPSGLANVSAGSSAPGSPAKSPTLPASP